MYDWLGGASMFEGEGGGDDPLPEPGAEFNLPVYAFKNLLLNQEVWVTHSLIALVECKIMLNLGRVVTISKFLKGNPHPLPYVTPSCETNERDHDYTLGSDVCVWCRDRLRVSDLVSSGAPAIRVTPAR